MDDIDRQQCQDIACHLGGHERCRRASPWDDIKRGAHQRKVAEMEADERCREEGTRDV